MQNVSLLVSCLVLSWALSPEARAGDLASCEAAKLHVAAAHATQVGRCQARSLHGDDGSGPLCLQNASDSLANWLAWLSAKGCDTVDFGDEVEFATTDLLTTLPGGAPDDTTGQCTSRQTRAVSRAVASGLRALARHQRHPSLHRLGGAERRIHSNLERVVAHGECSEEDGDAAALVDASSAYLERIGVAAGACRDATLATTSTVATGVPFCPGPYSAASQVQVSLDHERSVDSRFGALGFSGIRDVPNELSQPLRPRLIRTVFNAAEMGAALEKAYYMNLVLSDSYGYPPGWPVAPYDDSAPWLATVRSILEDPVLAEVMSRTPERVIFEPWNEPNIGIFWDGTLHQATDLWIETEQLIRSIYPDALVAGPSYVALPPLFMHPGELEAFLDRVVAVGSRVDYLVWHAFDLSVSTFRNRLVADVDRFITHPIYPSAGLKALLINEYPLTTLDLLPAENLAFMAAFEVDGVLTGARACWGGTHQLLDALDGSKWTNCGAQNIYGLLMPAPDWRPRALWWVYRLIAEGLERRVRAAPEEPGLVTALASNHGDGGAKVLVGHIDDGGFNANPSRAPIDIAVRISGIEPGRCVRTTVKRIPDSRSEPLESLEIVDESSAPNPSGTVHILLRGVPSHEVRVVEVSRCEPRRRPFRWRGAGRKGASSGHADLQAGSSRRWEGGV